MNLYMIVTNDRYELPVKCGLSAGEAAEFLGVKPVRVWKMARKPPKKSKYKAVVVGKYTPDKKSYQKQYQKKYRMTHDRSGYFREYYESRKRRQKEGRADETGVEIPRQQMGHSRAAE